MSYLYILSCILTGAINSRREQQREEDYNTNHLREHCEGRREQHRLEGVQTKDLGTSLREFYDRVSLTVIVPVQYNGAFYVIHDIYGIEQLKYGNTNPAEECVICLSAPRNSVVIPCRHLCLCNECAETLRYQSNKCPICRGRILFCNPAFVDYNFELDYDLLIP